MQIILEDKRNARDMVRYVPDVEESGIDSSIAFSGWNIDGWSAWEAEHFYPVYNETYSQYRFSVGISRIAMNSFMKTFLPVIFILLTVLFSFVMDPDKITTRLAMAGSALVASVMFHISIANQIPPVGYLTFADKFMILTYLILLVSFVVNITMIELKERKNERLVVRIHRLTEYSMLAVAPVLYALLFIFFMG